MKKPLYGIAREGYPLIIPPIAIGIILLLLGFKFTPSILLFIGVFCLFFFRDPQRQNNFGPSHLVSPADGKVIVVKEHDQGPVTGEHVVQISIFLNIFNVHVNRSPVFGTIVDAQYRPGRFHAADKEIAALENEHTLVAVDVTSGPRIHFKQIAGLVARRVVFWGKKGDTLEAGTRIGLMKFSSRMDLFIPADQITLHVREGQKVKAGITLLGEFRA